MKLNLQKIFTYPYDNNLLLEKQKGIHRELLLRENVSYTDIRIAFLSGSTIDDIKNVLELFLLEVGIRPLFYQSEYNKFYEDAVFENSELAAFKPNIVIIFTSVVNLLHKPNIKDDSKTIQEKLEAEYNRFLQIWKSLNSKYDAVILQNNFDFPPNAPLGSLEASKEYGLCHFIEELNGKFAKYSIEHNGFYIHDIRGLSARIGLSNWHNDFQYFAYKFAVNYDVMPEVALGLAKIIRGILGKTKKCLVLDLDNTLWGGVIGDDGVENIKIGRETPIGEVYTAWQEYVLKLKERGVILAVCSKNDVEIARSGFSHPDSVLHEEDFAAFYANWKPKNENIIYIAEELNIGTDSLVFIDDNPAERQIVRDYLPEVAVPEVDAKDVFSYIRAIEGAGYFEPIAISDDDVKRNDAYKANKARKKLSASSISYDEFLKSLDMVAEIDKFCPIYFDRIAQLTGKTNQFNLTTRRYTRMEIENMTNDSRYVTLYGRLKDKFGDNGLISVIIGEKQGDDLNILLWLMSCRVLKRGMEDAMMDALVSEAANANCSKIIGYYYPTSKNKMVADMYKTFGFRFVKNIENGAVWELLIKSYQNRRKYIEVERKKDE